MGTLHLVRHGQASFGSTDYDRLSELGQRQCVRLGEHFRRNGIVFEAALVGTLRRQLESLEGIAQGLQARPPTLSWPGLNEYDSEAVLHAIHPEPLPAPDSPEAVRRHFRLLRDGLQQWMDGRSTPRGMPTHAQFVAGITGALDHVRANHDSHVLLVSSGGPIATAVAHVLGAPNPATIELNLRIRNSAVTEFAFTRRRHTLLSFNTLPHLPQPEYTDWVSAT